jgi:hypothetical protein
MATPRRRPPSPRKDERQELETRWEESLKRRKAYPSPYWQAQERYLAELGVKVRKWNRRPTKGGKDVDAKDISGASIMDALNLAFALTNHPAYEAARKAMRLHRLDRGGLRRAFLKLQRRHGHDQVPCLYGRLYELDVHDSVQEYMDEFGYKLRQAIEHIVADVGMPGTSFADAVDKARKDYAKREIHDAERQQYLEELSGHRAPSNSR